MIACRRATGPPHHRGQQLNNGRSAAAEINVTNWVIVYDRKFSQSVADFCKVGCGC